MSNSRLRRRWPIAAVATTVALGALAWTSLAPAGAASAPDRVVVKAKGSGENMRFTVSDDSIQSGGNLVIKDRNSDPHTFSLVQRDLIPRTKSQIQNCFHKGHICSEIGSWHGATGNKPPTINPVDVGKPGWDREGNLHREGDSVFFKPKRKTWPATKPVTAKAGTNLHFICAIHPWMHGVLHVK
jgi:hypothetical protein